MRSAVLCCLLLQATAAIAQPFSLVKDINTSRSFYFNNNERIYPRELNGYLYYTAYISSYGDELWRSDLSSGKTELVKDIYPGEGSSNPSYSILYNGFIYFCATDGLTGQELWRTDGTATGTQLVKDIDPGPLDSYPNGFVIYNNLLFFVAAGELWRSDGTEQGTMLVKNIYTRRQGHSFPANLTIMKGILYFSADDGEHGRELWRSDGSESGTFMVRDIYAGADAFTGPNSSNPLNLTVYNDALYFAATTYANGSELWRSDGTYNGTVLIKDIYPGRIPGSPLGVRIVFNDKLYFTASNGATSGTGLWVTDGSPAGTKVYQTIDSGSAPPGIYGMRIFDGSLYLAASTSIYSVELWKTNGTADGFQKWYTADHFAGWAADQSHLYFANTEPGTGTELWVSDGTAAGTHLLKDIEPGPGSSSPIGLMLINDEIYFQTQTSRAGIGLWKTDGTDTGTTNVLTFDYGTANANIQNMVAWNDKVYFSARDSLHGQELWKSDGTAGGTTLVKDIVPGVDGSFPQALIVHDSSLYFTANQFLWRTDGTDAGTSQVPIGVFVGQERMVSLGKWLYFIGAAEGQFGIVYRTDGTGQGTFPINSGWSSGYSSPSRLTVFQGAVYFSAYNYTIGTELWKIDTASATAVPVRDILPGQQYSSPNGFTSFKNSLYFSANDQSGAARVWKTDGTEAGTATIPFPAGLKVTTAGILQATDLGLYLSVTDSSHGTELWKTDGTVAGTTMIKDIMPGSDGTLISHSCVMNGILYFDAYDSAHGLELWRSDGTVAGTYMVRETWPGPRGNGDGKIITNYLPLVVGNLLVLTRTDGIHGQEPWVSDGTGPGTFMVQDINPGSASSESNQYVQAGSRIFFTAYTDSTGTELWVGNVDNILPKFTIMLRGNLNDSNALLNWETENEYNVAEFKVQRSTDGKSFQSLADDSAIGGIHLHASYNFTDSDAPKLLADTLYYRIVVVSDSDELTYSDTVEFVNIIPQFSLVLNGVMSGHDVLLDWETDNERDVAGFEVQRSSDGGQFETIANDTPTGGINRHAGYHFTDKNADKHPGEMLYYRISAASQSGGRTYSDTIHFVIRNSIRYGPNPVRKELNLLLSSVESDNLILSLYNQQGAVLSRGEFHLNAGETSKMINVENLPVGIYYLSIKGSGVSGLIKFVKM